MEWEWECMCDCESVKEGFNAAGLSVQSAPEHRQDFHVSEGLDSKVKLKRGLQKKSFEEQDYVHFFIQWNQQQQTKG